jgi:hypothetical protein
MSKAWEYQIKIVATPDTAEKSLLRFRDDLNESGVAGWQLVHAMPTKSGGLMIIFAKERSQ